MRSLLRKGLESWIPALVVPFAGCGGAGVDAGPEASSVSDSGAPSSLDGALAIEDAGAMPADAGPSPVASVAPLALQGQSVLIEWNTLWAGPCRLTVQAGGSVQIITWLVLDTDVLEETLLGNVSGAGMVEITGALQDDGVPVPAVGWLTVMGVGVVHDSLAGLDPLDAAAAGSFLSSLVDTEGVDIAGMVDADGGPVALNGYEPVGGCNNDLIAFVGPEGTNLSPDTVYFDDLICWYELALQGCTCELP